MYQALTTVLRPSCRRLDSKTRSYLYIFSRIVRLKKVPVDLIGRTKAPEEVPLAVTSWMIIRAFDKVVTCAMHIRCVSKTSKDSLASIYVSATGYPLRKTIVDSEVFPIHRVRYKSNYIRFIYVLRCVTLLNIEIRSNTVLLMEATDSIKYRLVEMHIRYISNTWI